MRGWLRWPCLRIHLSENAFTMILASVVGLGAGVGVVLFRRAVEGLSQGLYTLTFLNRWPSGGWIRVLIPMFGGLAVVAILRISREREEMPGVAGLILAIATAGGRLPYWKIPGKILAAILSIGTGASVGPEDPSVQIGANLGSALGQRLRVSEDSMRLLVAAGAAGGIAAAFNAPIAGVLFATEILLGEFAVAPITALVLAAVAAALVAQMFLGPHPAFEVPAYAFRHPLELPLYLILGLAAGLISTVYIRLLYGMREAAGRLSLPDWIRTPAAGLILGLIGLVAPQALGVGYSTIEAVLQGEPWRPELALALMFLKMILTPFSLAAGFVGGVFAPALFVGAMLGYGYGALLKDLIPAWVAPPSAYAMVAMAAVLAGAVRAPFTATLLLFEMTRDYRIILPLMAAVGLSTVLSEQLQPGSLYTEALRRRGLRLSQGRDVDVMEGIRVEEVMNPSVVRIPSEMRVEAALEALTHHRRRTAIVETVEGRLWGIVTLRDLEMALMDGKSEEPVGRIARRPVITVFPDESMAEAVRRMSAWDIGQVPVVSREDPQRVIGIVRREEVVRGYDLALARKRLLQHRLDQIRLHALSGVEILEVPVGADAPAAGRPLGEISWPSGCRIAVVRRKSLSLIPDGRLILQPGDLAVLIGEPEALKEARRLLSASSSG